MTDDPMKNVARVVVPIAEFIINALCYEIWHQMAGAVIVTAVVYLARLIFGENVEIAWFLSPYLGLLATISFVRATNVRMRTGAWSMPRVYLGLTAVVTAAGVLASIWIFENTVTRAAVQTVLLFLTAGIWDYFGDYRRKQRAARNEMKLFVEGLRGQASDRASSDMTQPAPGLNPAARNAATASPKIWRRPRSLSLSPLSPYRRHQCLPQIRPVAHALGLLRRRRRWACIRQWHEFFGRGRNLTRPGSPPRHHARPCSEDCAGRNPARHMSFG